MGEFNARVEKKKDRRGCVDRPTSTECDRCGRDFHELASEKYMVGWQRRVLCKGRTGKLKEYAASEVFNWNQDGPTDWSTLAWRRTSLTFVRWLQECNECYYTEGRQTPDQKSELCRNMSKNGFTAKDTQKAYMLINRINAPKLLGAVDATREQKQWAAKYLLWHWPQASNEPMPDDIKALCNELVAT